MHPHIDETIPEAERPLTLKERLLALIVAPGRLFGELPLQPHRPSNWIVPWIILGLSTIVSGAVMLSDPHLRTQLATLIQDAIQSGVADGTFTQDEADLQLGLVGPGSPVFAVLWLAGPPAAALVTTFALAFLYSMIGRSAMSARAPFMKIVEVAGLTSIIRALETLATLGCVLLTGSVLATPSAALLLGSLEPLDALGFVLSRLNPFTFWLLGVTALGLAELFERDFPKVLVLISALWFLWTLLTLLVSF